MNRFRTSTGTCSTKAHPSLSPPHSTAKSKRPPPPPPPGLLITFAINALAAASARGIAARKQQPVLFWMAKVLLFGGLALGELAQAVPEAPPPPKRAGRL